MPFSRLLPIALTLGGFGLASSALAGYAATTKPFSPTIVDSDSSGGLSVNDTWGIQFAGFTTWTRDTTDDLFFGSPPPSNLYLRLIGRVASISGDQIGYTGTFRLFGYSSSHIGEYYTTTGSGNFSITSISNGLGGRTLSGQLSQTGGPEPYNTTMPDMGLRYGFNPVLLTGTTTSSGFVELQLQQTAKAVLPPVPEPATFAALGLGAAAMLRRRRKN